MEIRYDQGLLHKPLFKKNGWLEVSATLTRTGVFDYVNKDGSIRRELRLPDEVFKQESIESFKNLPVTDEHPNKLLDAGNTKEYQRGTVASIPFAREDTLEGTLLLTDRDLINKVVKKDKTAISLGYSCDIEETSGLYMGQLYDCIQRNILGNHVAIVDRGRAGSRVKIRLDAQDTREQISMETIVINGISYEISKSAKEAFESHMKITKENTDKLQARCDSLAEDLKKRTDAQQDTSRFDALVSERVSVLSIHERVLGVVPERTKKNNQDLKKDVVLNLQPKADLKDKSEAYVDARFDACVESLGDRNDALNNLRLVHQEPVQTARTEKQAREEMIVNNRKLSETKGVK